MNSATHVWATVLYMSKPGHYNQILLLAEMQAHDVLEAAFITKHHFLPSYEE